MPATPTNPAITKRFLIVGEGAGDAAFFTHLCEVRNIEGFQIEDAGGNTNFQRYLEGLPGRTGFDELEAALIVSDNDETPDDSWKEVRRQLKKADLPYPDNPLRVARRSTNSVAILVMMIPFVGNTVSRGCLETLLLESAGNHLPEAKLCVDSLCSCIDTSKWSQTSLDKMRLRCILASAWSSDPNVGLQWALKPDKSLIPLTFQCFDEIAAILGDFENFVAKGGIE